MAASLHTNRQRKVKALGQRGANHGRTEEHFSHDESCISNGSNQVRSEKGIRERHGNPLCLIITVCHKKAYKWNNVMNRTLLMDSQDCGFGESVTVAVHFQQSLNENYIYVFTNNIIVAINRLVPPKKKNKYDIKYAFLCCSQPIRLCSSSKHK